MPLIFDQLVAESGQLGADLASWYRDAALNRPGPGRHAAPPSDAAESPSCAPAPERPVTEISVEPGRSPRVRSFLVAQASGVPPGPADLPWPRARDAEPPGDEWT